MIDFAAVDQAISDGYIVAQKHPFADLRIYNYTAKAQFNGYWTPETKACRGLIVSGVGAIVARPFEKFFSYEQLNGQIPLEHCEVYEKLDGSLGILYWIGDQPCVATRGSFISEQAEHATALLRTRYQHVRFDPSVTYLFEIIYPANRIVVDYGDRDDLVLLAMIQTATGAALPLDDDLGMPVVRRYDGITELHQIEQYAQTNAEGFVALFESGQRVKFKFEEYKRLHRLLTGVNARHIWEELRSGRGIEPLIDRVPDEYYQWARGIESTLRAAYRTIEEQARSEYRVLETRKDTALYFQTRAHPSILFAMLDGKDYGEHIWKLIRPSAQATFRSDEPG